MTFEVTSGNKADIWDIEAEIPEAEIAVIDRETFNVTVPNSFVDDLVEYLDESTLSYRIV